MSPYLIPGGWSKLYRSVMNTRGLLVVLLIPLLCYQDVSGQEEGSGSGNYSKELSSRDLQGSSSSTVQPTFTTTGSSTVQPTFTTTGSSTVQPTFTTTGSSTVQLTATTTTPQLNASIIIKLSSVIIPSTSVSSSSVQPTSVLFSTPSGPEGTEMSSPNGTSGFVFWVYVGAPVVIVIAVLSLLLLLICCVCFRKKRTQKRQLRQGPPEEAYVVQNIDQKGGLKVSLECKAFNLPTTTDTFGITSPDNESTTASEHRTLQGYNDVSITQRPLKPAQSMMTINTQEPAVSQIKMLSPQLGRKQQRRDGIYDVPRKWSGHYSPGENPRYKGPPKKAVSTSALYPQHAMAQQRGVVDTKWTIRNTTGQENVNSDHGTYDVPREARLNAAAMQASSANHVAGGHMPVEIPAHYDVPRHALLAYKQSLPPRDIPRVDVEKREVKTLPPNAVPPKGHYYDIPKNTEARGGYRQPKRSNPDRRPRTEPDTVGKPRTGSRQTETSYSTYDVPKRAFTLPPESSGHYDVPKLALAAEREKRKIGRSESSPVHSQSGNIQRQTHNPLPPRLGTSRSLHNVPSQVLEESDSDPDHIYDEPPMEVVQEAIKKRYARHREESVKPVVNGMGHIAKRSASHHEISTRITTDYENMSAVNFASRAPPPVKKKPSIKSPSARKKWPYN